MRFVAVSCVAAATGTSVGNYTYAGSFPVETVHRRDLLGTIGAAGLTTTVAGCSSLLGGSCGPGEDTIEELATAEDEGENDSSDDTLDRITGEIQSISDDEIVLDDGTGTARLTTLGGGFEVQNVGAGDCAWATGVGAPTDDEEVDVLFLVRSVGLED